MGTMFPLGLIAYSSSQEIAHLLALEEATLSTDLQQGYALKSLTGIHFKFYFSQNG